MKAREALVAVKSHMKSTKVPWHKININEMIFYYSYLEPNHLPLVKDDLLRMQTELLLLCLES